MKVMKAIGYAFLSIVILAVLIIIFGYVKLYRSSLPVIHSDSQFDVSDVQKHSQLLSQIQYQAMEFSRVGKIPDDAQNLYFTSAGWLFPTRNIAFRLADKDKCEAFFMDNRMDLSEFEKGNLTEQSWNNYTLTINGLSDIRMKTGL